MNAVDPSVPRKRARGLSIRPRITFSQNTFEYDVFAPLSDAERRVRLEFYVRLGLEVAAGRFSTFATMAGAAAPLPAGPVPDVGRSAEVGAEPPHSGLDPRLEAWRGELSASGFFSRPPAPGGAHG